MNDDIFQAAHSNDAARINELLGSQPNLIHDRTTDFKRSPLHCASRRGNLEAAQALLQHGADPESPDQDGKTPRQLAKTEAMAQLLLQPRPDGSASA